MDEITKRANIILEEYDYLETERKKILSKEIQTEKDKEDLQAIKDLDEELTIKLAKLKKENPDIILNARIKPKLELEDYQNITYNISSQLNNLNKTKKYYEDIINSDVYDYLRDITAEENLKKVNKQIEELEQDYLEPNRIVSAYNQIKRNQDLITKLKSETTSDEQIMLQNNDLISLLVKQIEENKAVLPETLKLKLDKQEELEPENVEQAKEEPIKLDKTISEEIPANNQAITMEELSKSLLQKAMESNQKIDIEYTPEEQELITKIKSEEPSKLTSEEKETLKTLINNKVKMFKLPKEDQEKLKEKNLDLEKEELKIAKFKEKLNNALKTKPEDLKDIYFDKEEINWLKRAIVNKVGEKDKFNEEEKQELINILTVAKNNLERRSKFTDKLEQALNGEIVKFNEEEINWLKEKLEDKEAMSKFDIEKQEKIRQILENAENELAKETKTTEETIEEENISTKESSEESSIKPLAPKEEATEYEDEDTEEEKKTKKNIIGIRKPARSLLEKIKKSKVAKIAILATAVLLLAIGGKNKNEKIVEDSKVEVINEESNTEENIDTEVQEESNTPLQTTYDNNGNITSIADEEGNQYNDEGELIEINDTTVDDTYLEDNDIIIEDINNYDYNYETEYIDNSYTKDTNIKIGSTVTVNGNIHDNVYDAYYNENSKTPYYGTEPERVVIGVGIINNNSMNRIYAYDPEANTKIENLLNEGGEIVSILTSNKNKYLQDYDGTTSLSPEEIKAYAEGWYNINDIATQNTKGVSR